MAHDDWRSSLRRHLDTHDNTDALAGLKRAGWRLVYTTEPTPAYLQAEAEAGGLDLSYSVGLVVGDDGRVDGVAWDSPAFRAGITTGTRIRLVAGVPYSPDALKRAVAATPQSALTVDVGTPARPRPMALDFHGGLRYPRLESMPGRPNRLGSLLDPR